MQCRYTLVKKKRMTVSINTNTIFFCIFHVYQIINMLDCQRISQLQIQQSMKIYSTCVEYTSMLNSFCLQNCFLHGETYHDFTSTNSSGNQAFLGSSGYKFVTTNQHQCLYERAICFYQSISGYMSKFVNLSCQTSSHT